MRPAPRFPRRRFLGCAAAAAAAGLVAVARAVEDGRDGAAAQPPGGMRVSSGTHVYFHPDCLLHLSGRSHPERPARLEAIRRALASPPLAGTIRLVEPRPAREEDLLLCHTRAYVDLVRTEIAAGRNTLSTGDAELSPGSWPAALAAVGSVLAAVDDVVGGAARNAFCAVRPPGHHAGPERGMGFCLFNNLAIGVRHAQRRHGIGRVLVADWDVHHGNGTQDIFWRDGSVLFFDTHRAPWYPGTGAADERGAGAAEGLIMNRPFAAGAGRDEIVAAFRDTLLPAAERFRPELVMISAGFDSRVDDPLGGFALTDADYAELTALMVGIAERHAGGRLVSVLEGGYELEGLSSAVASHVAGLAAGPG